ncbi:uncharacterized protein [Malus domestica]|uniref:uncharacterized protein n=1 Tax=Malus domestica TaxID=3750 RepID=UPI0010AA0436|nr:uncharacterized protein LOC114822719 [Malus domestica]
MEFIGQIHPTSSKEHTFIIVAIDYFTKWVEASTVKTLTATAVKNFIETKILHRYGVPKTIVIECGPSFISKEVEEFASKFKIKMIQSSPYYPSQMVKQKPNLQEGTGTTPYALTFRQDDVLPMEINVGSVRIQNQFRLHNEEYIQAMCQGIEDLDVARIEALGKIQEGKRAVAQAYNKKVKLKNFKK